MPAPDGFSLSLWRRGIYHPPAHDNKQGCRRYGRKDRSGIQEREFSPLTGKNVHLTMSIGLAQYKATGNMKALFTVLTKLMYQARRTEKQGLF